eukprot:7134185-Prymnesium_polylepis.1
MHERLPHKRRAGRRQLRRAIPCHRRQVRLRRRDRAPEQRARLLRSLTLERPAALVALLERRHKLGAALV